MGGPNPFTHPPSGMGGNGDFYSPGMGYNGGAFNSPPPVPQSPPNGDVMAALAQMQTQMATAMQNLERTTATGQMQNTARLNEMATRMEQMQERHDQVVYDLRNEVQEQLHAASQHQDHQSQSQSQHAAGSTQQNRNAPVQSGGAKWDYQRSAPKLERAPQFDAHYKDDLEAFLVNLKTYGIPETVGIPAIKSGIANEKVLAHLASVKVKQTLSYANVVESIRLALHGELAMHAYAAFNLLIDRRSPAEDPTKASTQFLSALQIVWQLDEEVLYGLLYLRTQKEKESAVSTWLRAEEDSHEYDYEYDYDQEQEYEYDYGGSDNFYDPWGDYFDPVGEYGDDKNQDEKEVLPALVAATTEEQPEQQGEEHEDRKDDDVQKVPLPVLMALQKPDHKVIDSACSFSLVGTATLKKSKAKAKMLSAVPATYEFGCGSTLTSTKTAALFVKALGRKVRFRVLTGSQTHGC
eukprot:g20089.t1